MFKGVVKVFKLLRLVCCLLFSVLLCVNAEAVVVEKFNARLYDKPELDELREKDFVRMVAVELFKDSLRLHYDLVRHSNNVPDLLQNENWKYFLTLYDVIPNEIAKAMFEIEIKGDSVNYKNQNGVDIIECKSNGYKDVEEYTLSNWNYLLLINVLNRVVNTNRSIDDALIQDTAQDISKHFGDAAKEGMENAETDIKTYFNKLDLYSYLKRCRNAIPEIKERLYEGSSRQSIINLLSCFDDLSGANIVYYQASFYHHLHCEMVRNEFSLVKYDVYIKTKQIERVETETDFDKLVAEVGPKFTKNDIDETAIKGSYDVKLTDNEMYFINCCKNVNTGNGWYDEYKSGFIYNTLKKAETENINDIERIILQMIEVSWFLDTTQDNEYKSPYLLCSKTLRDRALSLIPKIIKTASDKPLNEMNKYEISGTIEYFMDQIGMFDPPSYGVSKL